MPGPLEALPDDATVILHVAKGRQRPQGGSVCESIDQDAFRCDEDGISVTWVEFFEGERAEQFYKAVHALKGGLTFKKSGVIISARVGDIRAVLAATGVHASVVTDEQPHNRAHCLIKGIAPDNLSGLLALSYAFPATGFVLCSTIEGLT